MTCFFSLLLKAVLIGYIKEDKTLTFTHCQLFNHYLKVCNMVRVTSPSHSTAPSRRGVLSEQSLVNSQCCLNSTFDSNVLELIYISREKMLHFLNQWLCSHVLEGILNQCVFFLRDFHRQSIKSALRICLKPFKGYSHLLKSLKVSI